MLIFLEDALHLSVESDFLEATMRLSLDEAAALQRTRSWDVPIRRACLNESRISSRETVSARR